MATPAAILSVVVKAVGTKATVGELALVDKAAKKTAASTTAVAASSRKMGASVAASGAAVGAAGSKIKGLAVPLVALGAASAKLAGEFGSSMRKIEALVGINRKQVQAWREDLLKMSDQTGKSAKELADALFFVTSAGLRGSAAIETLRISARASAAGLGETKVIADAVTSAINAYGAANLSAAKASDILVATVREGKTEAASLAPVLGRVIPIAEAMGVEFHEVGAAMAALTRTGSNAAQASTQVRAILSTFAKPAKQTVDAFDKMGLSVERVRDIVAKRGLADALFLLRKRAQENGVEFSSLFPNVRALGGFLSITGRNAKANATIFENLAKSAGSTDKAFNVMSKTAGFKMRQAVMKLESTLISVGQHVLPAIVPVVQKLGDWIGKAGEAFRKLSPEVQRTVIIIGAIAAAAGPVLIMLGGLIATLGALVSPIGLIVGALALAAAAFVTAYKRSAEFRSAVQGVIAWIQAAIPKVGAVFRAVFGWLEDNVPVVVGAVVTAFGALVTAVRSVIQWVRNATAAVRTEIGKWDVLFAVLGAVATFLTTVFRPAFTILRGIFKVGLAAIVAIAKAGWELVKGVFSGAWTAIKGIVTGGLQIVRGVIRIIGGLFKGDFDQMWEGIKDIFSGGVRALGGILRGAWSIIKGALSGLATGFVSFWGDLWGDIKKIFAGGVNILIDFINAIIGAINALPAIPHIDPIKKVQFARGGVVEMARGGAYQRTGGVVGRPMVMMGEEAPRWPEYVIPTNPRYRKNAWSLIGRAMGAVGMQAGGRWGPPALERLWVGVKGAASMARMMAIIATAESGVVGQYANQYARNPSGATGLWQILGAMVPGNLTNATVNARNAVAKLGAQGLGAWEASRHIWEPYLQRGANGGIAGSIGDFVGNVLGKLPNPGDIPKWLRPVGGYVLDNVKDWIGDTFSGQGHPGAGGGGSAKVVQVGHWLQSLGYLVGEHPAFGGVRGAHDPDGYHPIGRAIDVNWPNAGEEPAMLDRIVGVLRSMNPLELLWRVKDHFDHLHVAFQRGGIFGMQGGGFWPFQPSWWTPPPATLPEFVHALKTGPSKKIRGAAVSAMMDQVHSLGLPSDLVSRLTSMSGLADLYAQNADMAGALTDEGAIREALQAELNKRVAAAPPELLAEAAKIAEDARGQWFTDRLFPAAEQQQMVEGLLGRVGGKTQLQWLVEQLAVTLGWRNAIIQAEGMVMEKRAAVQTMLEEVRTRLADWREKVADRAKKVAELVKERTRLQELIDDLKPKLSKLRDDLKELRKHPHKNAAKIAATLAKIGGLENDLGNARTALGVVRDQLPGARDRLRDAIHVRDGLVTLRDGLVTQRTTLNGVRGGLLSDLQKVQGFSPDMTPYDAAPAIGTLGGTIFDTQMKIRELTEKPIRVLADVPTAAAAEVAADPSVAILQELLREANLRTAVSEAAFAVFRDFPSFGGGGIIPGPLGAPVPMIGHAGEGVFTPDQMSMLGRSDVRVIIEDHRTRVFVDDAEYAAEKVTRRQARQGARRLPGRGGGLIG